MVVVVSYPRINHPHQQGHLERSKEVSTTYRRPLVVLVLLVRHTVVHLVVHGDWTVFFFVD